MTGYSITVRQINPGTDGSSVGHVWITLGTPTGFDPSWGFYPDGLQRNDDASHPVPDFEKSWSITEQQYNAVQWYINGYLGTWYKFPWEVCTDFAVGALEAAGVPMVNDGDGPLFPSDIKRWLDTPNLSFDDIWDEIVKLNPELADLFTRAQQWVWPRDPMTLDLDGDGLEVVPVSSTNPILFDHDGDGIRNATGWIKADDGFLVMDRNGNGAIDAADYVLWRDNFGQTAASGASLPVPEPGMIAFLFCAAMFGRSFNYLCANCGWRRRGGTAR